MHFITFLPRCVAFQSMFINFFSAQSICMWHCLVNTVKFCLLLTPSNEGNYVNLSSLKRFRISKIEIEVKSVATFLPA